jgi:hypothetical protein
VLALGEFGPSQARALVSLRTRARDTARKDLKLKLYHFTGLRALIGEKAFAKVKSGSFNHDTADRGSILKAGLKPSRSPANNLITGVVWLTNDPDMPAGFCGYHHYRVTVHLDRSDAKLHRYVEFLDATAHVPSVAAQIEAQSELDPYIRRAAETFWIYFGAVRLEHFVALDPVTDLQVAA